MTESPFVGTWTYRSFHNMPEVVDDFNKLRFAQAELVLVSAPLNSIRGELRFGTEKLLINGAYYLGRPFQARFQGVGVPGTATAGWVYDYEGCLVSDWPHGDKQRSAFVGSVIRTAPHDGRPAGVVASFIAVKRDFSEARNLAPLPDSVRWYLASRHHRLHHMVWHLTRNFWEAGWLTDRQRQEVTNRGWRPPRPSWEYIGVERKSPYTTTGAGIDFLFMHRQMIKDANEKMAEAGAAALPTWAIVPEPRTKKPGDAVPPTWIVPDSPELTARLAAVKSEDFYWSRMRWWDQEFKDPVRLASLTLGQLGAQLEFSIHNDLHMRWSSVPRDPITGEEVPNGRRAADIDPKHWDHVDNDYLGDFYSSHVHPVFWRLHSWIDNRVDDWFAAHEAKHPGEVTRCDCHGFPWFHPGPWVEVENPWTGPNGDEQDGHTEDHGHHGSDPVKVMEEVVKWMFDPPPEIKALIVPELQRLIPQWASEVFVSF